MGAGRLEGVVRTVDGFQCGIWNARGGRESERCVEAQWARVMFFLETKDNAESRETRAKIW